MRTGFTLIELLIVVGIIAILAAAIVIAVSPGEQLASARDSTRDNHLHSLNTSLTSHLVSEGTYPETVEEIMQEICNTNDDGIPAPNDCEGNNLVDLSMLDLPRIPVDPQGGDHEYGTGYYVGTGSLRLHAPKAETRVVSTNQGWSYNGLVGWWRLDEGIDCVANDRASHQNQGFLEPDCVGGNAPEWVPGGHGGSVALRFDGIEHYVDVENSEAYRPTAELTIATWFRANPQSGYTRFVSANSTANVGYDLHLYPDSVGGRLQFNLGVDGGSNISSNPGVNLRDEEWHHVAATWDGSTMKLFIDGIQQNQTRDISGEVSYSQFLVLGASASISSHYSGELSGVRIYDRALSAEEIELLYTI